MAHPNPRQTQYQLKHYLRKTFNYNDVGIASGVYFGTIPAGSIITRTDYFVGAAFNAATTNVPSAGSNAGSYNNAVTAPTNTTNAQAAQTPTGTALGPLAADTDFFVQYTQTGAAATAGQMTVIVEYVPNNDQ